MDTIGYLILAALAFVILKMFGNSSANQSSFLGGGIDPVTGAPVIDSGQFVGPVQSMPATRTANGTYYCPIPTKLFKDARTGNYLCMNPTNVPAAMRVGNAAATASAVAATVSAGTTIAQELASLFHPSGGSTSAGAPQPTLTQLQATPDFTTAPQPTLTQLLTPDLGLGTGAPVIDNTSLPSNVPVDLGALLGTQPTATVTLDYQASAPLPVPAPIAGLDPILGSGSTLDPTVIDTAVTLPNGFSPLSIGV